MISAFHLTLVLFLLYPLLSCWDYWSDIREYRDYQNGIYKKRWVRNISERSMWLSPFLLLLAEGNFWHTLGYYFIPLCFYFSVIDWLSYLKGIENKLKFFIARLGVFLGRILLAIMIYYLVNHLSRDYASIVITILLSVAIFIFMLTNKKTTELGGIMMIAYGLILLVLPFFSSYPFWNMGLNILFAIGIPIIAMMFNSGYGNSIFVSLLYFLPTQIVLMVGYACFLLVSG